MLVRNTTSYNDLESKRNLLMRLLEVEAENETENERRVKEFKNPYKPAVVPPRYKSNAEMKRDKLEQEKEAIQHFIDLGFSYNRAGEMVAWLGDIDRLNKFNSYFKGIKKELSETTNPKLLSSEFLKNYLDRYFDDIEVNFGHKFGRNDVAGAPVPQSFDEINTILPDNDNLASLKDDFEAIITRPDIPDDLKREISRDIIPIIDLLVSKLPTESLLSYLKASLTQTERVMLLKKLSTTAKSIKLISDKEIEDLLRLLPRDVSVDELEIGVNRAKRALGFASGSNLEKIWKLIEKYAIELDKRGNVAVADELEVNLDLEAEEAEARAKAGEEEPAPVPKVRKKRDMAKGKRKNLENYFDELEESARNEADLKIYLNETIDDLLRKNKAFEDMPETEEMMEGMRLDAGGMSFADIDEMKAFIARFVDYKIETEGAKYNPTRRPSIKVEVRDEAGNPRQTRLGLGLPKKIIKHLKKDDKEAKELAKAFKKHKKIEEETEESSSDEEMGKKGKGHTGFRHTRIKVGGGVRVREQPTYAHFGKYIIHMPHLTDKNVFNVKYPSKGSIPAIKPMTISDDYKDFVMEILESGKMNERALKKLPEQEVRHFEKVVSGAGLTEVLKLKRGNTDSEKKDMDRYYLLRGEIEAGNNAETVVKELRGLIVKFMNDGRVNKSEGLNLLMELSVI